MVFWRKNKNQGLQEQEERDEKLLHPKGEPEIEPPTESDPELDSRFVDDELEETATEIIEDWNMMPTPRHTPAEDADEYEDLKDHSEEGGWFTRLTRGLSKSSSKIGQGISDIFTKSKLDADSLQELEDLLITADLGPKTAGEIVKAFSARKFDGDATVDDIKAALAEEITAILAPVAQPLKIEKPENGPFTILVCGVNGAGKTTTIGKLAYQWHMKEPRYKVTMAAGDTFRAAAVEQLEVWAGRAHVPLVKKELGTDAAAVAFEAYEQAKKDGSNILMIDTAGRLQNKSNLMAELEKIVRVLKKQDENLPHAVLLVLDATTGQNAHSQVEAFKEAVNLTGLIVTKLDGSAKGGVVVSLAKEFGLPIHAVGVGEKENHLSPFQAGEFAKALVGLSE